MSELTITVIRFAFLILMWVFVALVLGALRRDLFITGPRRTARTKAEKQAAETAPAPAAQRGAAQSGPAQSGPAPAQAALVRVRPRQLAVLEGPQAGAVVQMGDAPVLLGRAQEATLVLQDDYASGRHARLFPQGSRWFIEDLGSTNGTYVGSERLTRAIPVEAGTPMRIGKTVFELRN